LKSDLRNDMQNEQNLLYCILTTKISFQFRQICTNITYKENWI